MSNAALLKVYDGQEPDLCFGTSPGPGGVNSVNVGAGLTKTGTSANPIVNLGTTAVGDLLVGTATANAATILPKGANGNFLRVKTDGTGLEYAAVAPGGVDSVSALANNPVVVSTTAPASATDPKIGIAFTAKADVPVGTAANTGVMVSAPLPLTTGLFLQTDTGEASGVKWAPATGPSGAIGTNAPLVDDYNSTTGANTLSINFSTTPGEIPYGNGTAKIGALLAPPTGSGAVGKVLTYTGVVQGQPAIGWTTPVQPVGGDTLIVRSSAQDNIIPTPTDQDTQLVLVAETLTASWDLFSQLPTTITNYQPDFYFSSADGTKNYMSVAYDDGTHGRVSELWKVDGVQANAVLLGTFAFETQGGSVADDAQLFCACNGNDPYTLGLNYFTGTNLQGKILLGGKFNRFYPFSQTPPTPPTIAPYAICVLDTANDSISYIQTGPGAQEIIYGFTNFQSPDTDTTTIIRTITPFPQNALAWLGNIPQQAFLAPGVLIGGTFDTLYKTDAQGLPDNDTGFSAMAVFYLSGGSPTPQYFAPSADVVQLGFYVNNAATAGSCQCAISKIIFNSAYTKFYVSGDVLQYLLVNDTAGAAAITPANNSAGFLVYEDPGILGGNAWAGNLPISSLIPPFNTNDTRDIAFSSALPGYIILSGPQMALVDVATDPLQYAWTAISPVAPTLEGWYNSIVLKANVQTPSGLALGDWILQVNPNTGTQAIGYFTNGTGTTQQSLPPVPTGVVNASPGGVFTNYFRALTYNATQTLAISGPKGEYWYDATTHPSISFTTTPPMLFQVPAGTTNLTKATFSSQYQSQSYIASSDKAYWVQIAAVNPNLSYS